MGVSFCSCGNVSDSKDDDDDGTSEHPKQVGDGHENSVSAQSPQRTVRTASEIEAAERVHRAETVWKEEEERAQAESKRLEAFKSLSSKGCQLVKHGRRGKPHPRRVRLDWDKLSLDWESNCVSLKMFKVHTGKTTQVFLRAKNVSPDVCFSVITSDRTVDLECETKKDRDEWVWGLQKFECQVDTAMMTAKSTLSAAKAVAKQ